MKCQQGILFYALPWGLSTGRQSGVGGTCTYHTSHWIFFYGHHASRGKISHNASLKWGAIAISSYGNVLAHWMWSCSQILISVLFGLDRALTVNWMSIMVQTRKRTRKCHDGLSVFDVFAASFKWYNFTNQGIQKENHASCVMETVNHAPPCSVSNYTSRG